MALRNKTTSMSHSTKPSQVFSPAGAEARTYHYGIFVISPACSLMVPFSFISPTERKFQLPPQRFPNKSHSTSQDFLAGFHKAHRKHTSFLFPNRVYFSDNGNSSINASTSKYEGLRDQISSEVL